MGDVWQPAMVIILSGEMVSETLNEENPCSSHLTKKGI
jgi:hypothetical protein